MTSNLSNLSDEPCCERVYRVQRTFPQSRTGRRLPPVATLSLGGSYLAGWGFLPREPFCVLEWRRGELLVQSPAPARAARCLRLLTVRPASVMKPPRLQLCGRWLRQHGFEAGDRVRVRLLSPGVLAVVREASAAPQVSHE